MVQIHSRCLKTDKKNMVDVECVGRHFGRVEFFCQDTKPQKSSWFLQEELFGKR